MQPYRVEELLPTRAKLVVELTDPRRFTPAQKAFNIGLAGLTTAIGTALAGFPLVAGGTLALASALAVWRWRRANGALHITLTVERGDVVVATPSDVVRTRLVDLEDVSLDTKTIRKVIAGHQPTPAVTTTNLSPEIDQSRIVLSIAERRPFPLTDGYLAYMDAVEHVGKIRSFLREHGWVPEDERED